MRVPLTSMEQLEPFPTAQQVIAKKPEPLVSVQPGNVVQAALQLMADKHVGFLPVIDGGLLAGVLSERDCARRVILKHLPAATTTVREIMTTQVHSVTPNAKIP